MEPLAKYQWDPYQLISARCGTNWHLSFSVHLLVQKMEGLYGKLAKKYPDMAKKSETKLEEVRENWNRLEDLANARLVGSLTIYYVLFGRQFYSIGSIFRSLCLCRLPAALCIVAKQCKIGL